FLAARVNVVDENVVGLLEIVPIQKRESAGDSLEFVFVDAIDDIEAIDGVELHQHGSHGLHVIQLLQLVGDGDGHRSATESHKDGRGGRLNHHVGSDPFGALGGFGHKAGGEANHENHESNFHCDAYDRDQGPEGAMQNVLNNHVLDQGRFS